MNIYDCRAEYLCSTCSTSKQRSTARRHSEWRNSFILLLSSDSIVRFVMTYKLTWLR